MLLALGFEWGSGETLLLFIYYMRRTPLVIGGNRTRVLSDSMAIAVSALVNTGSDEWKLAQSLTTTTNIYLLLLYCLLLLLLLTLL